MNKKITAVLLAAVLFLTAVPFTAGAQEDSADYAYITVEGYTLGLEHIIAPEKLEIKQGQNAAEMLLELLTEHNMEAYYGGTADNGFYLTGIGFEVGLGPFRYNVNIPQAVRDNVEGILAQEDQDGILSAGEYTTQSCWLVTVNNRFPSAGLSDIYPQDGDVIRVQFSLAWGQDIGASEDFGGYTEDFYETANKDELIKECAEYLNHPNCDWIYTQDFSRTCQNAWSVLRTVNSTQQEVDEIVSEFRETYSVALRSYEIETMIKNAVSGRVQQDGIDKDMLDSSVFLSQPGSSYTNWMAVNIGNFFHIRDNTRRYKLLKQDSADEYLYALEQYVTDTYAEHNGKLDAAKPTEWHRVALTVLALGRNPQVFGTYNGRPIDLISDGIYSSKINPDVQGVNAWIWGLTVLGAGDFSQPDTAKYSLQTYIDKVLEYQLETGGWTLYGSAPEVDLTAMAITALAPYYTNNSKVKAAVDKGLDILKGQQQQDGSFASYGMANSMSTAQVVLALTSMGINIDTDQRFITGTGKTAIDGLLQFAKADGSFSYDKENYPEYSYAATDQATQALIAYFKYLNHQGSYFSFKAESNQNKPGDANCDGLVDIKDVTAIQRHLADVSRLTERGMVLADVNHDSTISINDATLIQKYMADLVTL